MPAGPVGHLAHRGVDSVGAWRRESPEWARDARGPCLRSRSDIQPWPSPARPGRSTVPCSPRSRGSCCWVTRCAVDGTGAAPRQADLAAARYSVTTWEDIQRFRVQEAATKARHEAWEAKPIAWDLVLAGSFSAMAAA